MLTSKQRAFLRAKANKMNPILHIGKDKVNDGVIEQAEEALIARELIKANVLDNSLMDVRDAAHELANAVDADVVQVIGNKFIIFRRNPEEPVYNLP